AATVTGCTFTANQYGVAVGDSSAPFLASNLFDGNSIAGVSSTGAPGPEIGRTLSDANDFLNPGFAHVFNTGGATVDAEYNWWGDICQTDYPDWFYGDVDYIPWTDEAHGDVYTECTGVPEEGDGRAFASYNFPNPFNPSTTIRYRVPDDGGQVRLAVYDLRGRLVKTLVAEEKRGGEHLAVWYGRDDQGREMASGVYFYRLDVGDESVERKMVMLK
ncbi:MAG: T9SS type A sorting domain-containing protein, partial [Candidatus Eisenbacteria bacterium]|nr:T9SS type A sorting domain-containing protein [Candidatus Eisenbacteria bacterium]